MKNNVISMEQKMISRRLLKCMTEMSNKGIETTEMMMILALFDETLKDYSTNDRLAKVEEFTRNLKPLKAS